MIIRQASLTDLPALQAIGEQSYTPHYPHLWNEGGVEWYMERCFGTDFLRKELADPNVEYYFIEIDAQIIGVMKLLLQKALPDSIVENALYLEKLYFVKEWTGKSVGRKLIDFAAAKAKKLNRELIWLTAMDSSVKPIAAYERAGFVFHSTMRLSGEFELMKPEFRGMIVMKKELKDE